ncbi:MAG: DUF4112 domain-containing protein [Jannaschia sp.]
MQQDIDPAAPPKAPGVAPEVAARLAALDRLAHGLDSRFRLPGKRIRFGWDAILGIVPGFGDVATLAPAGYILREAHRMGAPARLTARMAANVALDWVVGSVPVIGDLLDVGVKANRRNVALLRTHVERGGAPEQALWSLGGG